MSSFSEVGLLYLKNALAIETARKKFEDDFKRLCNVENARVRWREEYQSVSISYNDIYFFFRKSSSNYIEISIYLYWGVKRMNPSIFKNLLGKVKGAKEDSSKKYYGIIKECHISKFEQELVNILDTFKLRKIK